MHCDDAIVIRPPRLQLSSAVFDVVSAAVCTSSTKQHQAAAPAATELVHDHDDSCFCIVGCSLAKIVNCDRNLVGKITDTVR